MQVLLEHLMDWQGVIITSVRPSYGFEANFRLVDAAHCWFCAFPLSTN